MLQRLVVFLAVVAGAALAPFAAEAKGRGGFTIPSGIDRRKLDPQPDYERTMKEGAEAKGASVECTSGYRSDSQQADACRGACKGKVPAGQEAKGCPGFCAPPGRSNHQHVATCDMKGIPGSAQQGCDFLFEMCQQMRSRDNSLQCEIGGYGPGAHHLAVGRGIKPSAYNQCKHLKSKMGMDPGRDKRLQDDANKLRDEIMGNPNQQAGAPQMPQMPQPPASSPPASYPSSANSSPPASYPTAHNGATSPTPGSARVGKNSGDNSKGPISIEVPKGISDPNYSDVTKGKIADGSDPSGITGGGGSPSFQAFGGGPVQSEGGRDFTGASKPGGGSAKSGGFGSGASSSSSSSASSGGAKGEGAKGDAAAGGAGQSSEVLANYAGGVSGGKLGGSKASVQGSEVASAVQSLEQEFGAAPDAREPASEQGAVGEQESGSLFDRMREAHTRCLRRGCVSRAR